MSSLIGQLKVLLSLDSAAFETGAKRASARAKTTGDQMEAMGHKVGTISKAMVAAGAVIVGSQVFGAVSRLVSQGLEYASALGEQATQLGVTTKALQEYRYAATQAGVDQGEMDAALAKLTRTMGEAAQGAKGPSEAFAKLGIDIKAFVASGGDAGDLIPRIAEGLKGIQSPAEQAAVVVDLFGKSGQKLMPLLSEGAQGVNNLRDAAQRLGVVLSSEQIQKADETADKLAELKTVLSAKIAGEVADNTEAIIALANALTFLIEKAGAAVRAWREWRMEVAIRQNKMIEDGWLTSDSEKAAARDRRVQLQRQLDQSQGRITATTLGNAGGRSGGSTINGAAVGGYRTSPPVNLPKIGGTPSWARGPGLSGDPFGGIKPRGSLGSFGGGAGGGGLLAHMYGWRESDVESPQEWIRGSEELHRRARRAVAGLAEANEGAGEVITSTAQELAAGVMGALQGVLGAFGIGGSGGKWFNRIMSLVGLGDALGKAGVFGAGGKEGIGGLLGGLFGGPRANGGAVNAGKMYLVGERGPELFAPGRSGSIIPNHAMGGGTKIFDMRGAVMTADLMAQVEALAANRADVAVLRNNARQQKSAQRRLAR